MLHRFAQVGLRVVLLRGIRCFLYVAALSSLAPSWATAHGTEAADLIYDRATGDVVLDQSEAAGGVIVNFVLQSDGAFRAPGVASFPYTGQLITDQVDEISQTDPLLAGLPENPFSLGPILPPGLSLDQLESVLSLRVYVGTPGTGVGTFDLFVREVPEPSTASLLVALAGGVAGGLGRRRRRSSGPAVGDRSAVKRASDSSSWAREALLAGGTSRALESGDSDNACWRARSA